MPKCMIGMSGGVDSSVAAYLLQKQGYDCIGVTMKLYDGAQEGTCCSLDDTEDAKAICRRLGIPHYTFNFVDDFEEMVMKGFVSEYEAGRTPNPCIACNRYLKFQRLWQRARELGCDYLATGHYAKISANADGGFWLCKAADGDKDQSYVLYFLNQEQLTHTLFPLGVYTKAEVREIAQNLGFINAKKHDSQDICFIPDGDYGAFMETYTGHTYQAGDFLDQKGNVIGKHRGAVRYTIGQRRGLGVAVGQRIYVTSKNMDNNTVTLGSNDDLFALELKAQTIFLQEPLPAEGKAFKAKVRYRQIEQHCYAYPDVNGVFRVVFSRPQRAITAGQSVVLYDGDKVYGGGTIL